MISVVAPLLLSSVALADPPRFSEGLFLPAPGRSGRSAIRIDPIERAIVEGRFARPAAGDAVQAADGTERRWERIEPTDGAFRHPRIGGGYLSTVVEVGEAGTYLLEAVGHSLVYVNGEPRAGDPYRYGFLRLPVALDAGENEFLFVGGRGPLEARLVALPSAEPFFLGADDTLFDPVVGEQVDAPAGIVIVNPTDAYLVGWSIEARLGSAVRRTPLPSIPPLCSAKVRVDLAAPPPKSGDSPAWTLAIVGPDARAVARRELAIPAVAADARRRITRVSAIDGSVQYDAIVPPSDGAERPGLLLSLHGASVEATGQAACYAPRPGLLVVCPTNRRPFGFDWEDWGRLDALEALEHASDRFSTDPLRQWLTGHSMGGHGTWQLAAHYPDRFAAIGPSAGWISFRSYGGAPPVPDDDDSPVADVLRRAASPSETLALLPNVARLGVFILHGDADETVPVREARTMRAALASGDGAFHSDLVYYERPGAGHWWGNECVDWPPLIDFLLARTLPDPASDDALVFTTSAPSVSSRHRWISIEQQLEPFRPSRVEILRDREKGSFAATTSNVALLVIATEASTATIAIDGEEIATTPIAGRVVLRRAADGSWSSGSVSMHEKRADRGGPLKDAWRRRFVYVVGTAGDDAMDAALLAKARYDAETFWYRGNGLIEVVADTTFDPAAYRGRNVILIGNADTNLTWSQMVGDAPLTVGTGAIWLGLEQLDGSNLAALVVRPRPDDGEAMVAALAGTGLAGQRLLERTPLFVSGAAFPDYLIVGTDMLEVGRSGIRRAGFFANDWSLHDEPR